MSKETVTISKSEYNRLLRKEAELDALECFGVDNWGGYGDAISSLDEEGEE